MPQPASAFAVTWRDHDRAPQLTTFVVVLLVGAVALRLIGIPPVSLHGPLHFIGVMDPLCGGTRATYLLLSGDLAGAARYNPIVFPLAAVALGILVRIVVGRFAGRWLDLRLPRAGRRAACVAAGLALVALEIRQQLNADLLMQGWPA